MMREEVDALVAINQTKGADYSPDEDDALSFFTDLAAEVGLTPQQVWSVLATKHWQAVLTYCKRAHDDGYEPSEAVRGRILDLILYLFLLLGIDGEPVGPEDAEEDGEPGGAEEGDHVIRRRDGMFWGGEGGSTWTSDPHSARRMSESEAQAARSLFTVTAVAVLPLADVD